MEVRFAGFSSDTLSLQEAGWRLAVEEDFQHGAIRMLMRHEGLGLYMVADDAAFDYFMHARQQIRPRQPIFVVRYAARSLNSQVCNLDFSKFTAVDAMPHRAPVSFRRIEDFALFGAPLVKTEEIIVEPQSVAECLDLIRKMQAPELAAVRQRNLARDRDQPMAQQQFHAQILSLAA